MIRLPPLAKAALASLLFLLLAAEWLVPGPTALLSQPAPPIPGVAAGNAQDAAVDQWGTTSLARPLFRADRRPAPEAGADTSASLPRLSAIIIVNGTPSAVFAADGEKPVVATEGQTIGPYQVKSIFADRVELFGSNGLLTLHPQFASPPSSGPGP
jgi:hypothetical protein